MSKQTTTNCTVITCLNCASKYRIDSSQISSQGRDVRCTNCDNIWRVSQNDVIEQTDMISPNTADNENMFSVSPKEHAGFSAVEQEQKKQSYTSRIISFRRNNAKRFWHRKLRLPSLQKPSSRYRLLPYSFGLIINFIAWPLAISSAAIVILSGLYTNNNSSGFASLSNQIHNVIGLLEESPNKSFIIENVGYQKDELDNKSILVISGSVKNISYFSYIPPFVSIKFLLADRSTAQQWKLQLDKNPLAPQQSKKFISRLPAPDDAIKSILVSLHFSDFATK